MESLGVVETVSGEGRFVVKATAVPEIDEAVLDSKGKRIGTVKRVFGPIEGPYVTVSAEGGTPLTDIVGNVVYYCKGEIRNGKGKRRH